MTRIREADASAPEPQAANTAAEGLLMHRETETDAVSGSVSGCLLPPALLSPSAAESVRSARHIGTEAHFHPNKHAHRNM